MLTFCGRFFELYYFKYNCKSYTFLTISWDIDIKGATGKFYRDAQKELPARHSITQHTTEQLLDRTKI